MTNLVPRQQLARLSKGDNVPSARYGCSIEFSFLLTCYINTVRGTRALTIQVTSYGMVPKVSAISHAPIQ